MNEDPCVKKELNLRERQKRKGLYTFHRYYYTVIAMKVLKNRKGISTLITMLIILAISIALAIGVGYYLLSVPGKYTKTEELLVSNLEFNLPASGNVTITVKNIGVDHVTVSKVFVNGVQASLALAPVVVPANTETDLIADQATAFVTGNTYLVKIVTANGAEFSRTEICP
jgi:hypothetical protein